MATKKSTRSKKPATSEIAPPTPPEPRKRGSDDVPPPWQAPDYEGPITGDQMLWRRRHLKPVREVSTK